MSLAIIRRAVVAAALAIGLPTLTPVAVRAQAPALQIDSVVPDTASETLTIAGVNFGPRPLVTLNLIPLDVRVAIDTRLVVAVPLAAMPPGRYLLTVSRGAGTVETASVEVDVNGGRPASLAPPSTAVPLLAGGDPAATVADRTITVAEVDREWQRTDPAGYLALMRQLDANRRRVANSLVADQLIAGEAAARSTTSEALLKAELPKRTIAMPDAAVTSLYLSLGDRTRGASLDQMRPALRAWMATHTEPELARMNFVEELMKTSTRADVVLPALRTDVEVTSRDPVLGPATAPVTVVAFGDLQSNEYLPLAQTFGRVRETFGDRVRIVFRLLPTFGAPSVAVAQAAACAHAQGRFWAYHDAAVRPGSLDDGRLTALAKEVGLEPSQFAACRRADDGRDLAQRAIDDAARYGITGSPSLIVNGRMAPAPPPFLPPFEFLKRLIEEELQRQARASARG